MRTTCVITFAALMGCQAAPLAVEDSPSAPSARVAPDDDPSEPSGPSHAPAEPDFVTPIEPRFHAWRCGQTSPPAPVGGVDWCNADLQDGLAHLRAGIGELHEYEDIGGPHDTHLFRLIDLAEFAQGQGLAVLVRQEDIFANGADNVSLRLYIYERKHGGWILLDVHGLADAPEAAVSESFERLFVWTRSPERSCRREWTAVDSGLDESCIEA